jgi:cytochrome b561
MKPETYDPLAKSLHWLMALLIIGLWAVGIIMEDLPKGDLKGQVYGLHKGIGVILLALTVLRLTWRTARGAPALPDSMRGMERTAAHAGHVLLYVLMVTLPISGILMSQTGGRPVAVFGWTLPTLAGKNEALHEVFEGGHAVMAWALAALLIGHVLAALRHHVMLKDNVLSRMLPGRS